MTDKSAIFINNDLYSSIFEKIVDGIITKVNTSIVKLFGYAQEELIGKNVNMLMPDPHRTNHNNYLSSYKNTKKKNIIDTIRGLYAIKKNGDIFPMELSVSELDEKYFLGIIRDMTIMDNITDPIVTINNKGTILKINKRDEELFGYTTFELLGKNVNILMQDPYKSSHDQYLENYMTTGIKKIIGTIRDLKALKRVATSNIALINLSIIIP